LLAFTVIPLVELYLLLWLSERIGLLTTVSVVLVTGVLGAALARSEGLKVLKSWQTSLSRGQVPQEGVIGGALVLVGGVLLVTPGVLTDALGLSLLIPATRRLLGAWLVRRIERGIERGTVQVIRPPGSGFGRPPQGPGVIDVESEVVNVSEDDAKR